MLAILAESKPFDQVSHMLIGVFCVAGGLLIGGFLGGFLVRLLFPMKNRKAPAWMQKIGRLVGGLALGVAVYFMYFGGSGGGEGGDIKDLRRSPDHNPGEVKAPGEMKITLLGGDARDNKFYLIDEEKVPADLEAVKVRVDARRADPTKPLKVVTIDIYKNSSAKEGTVARSLDEFLMQRGLEVKYRNLSDYERNP